MFARVRIQCLTLIVLVSLVVPGGPVLGRPHKAN